MFPCNYVMRTAKEKELDAGNVTIQLCKTWMGFRGVGGGGHQRCRWRWASEV